MNRQGRRASDAGVRRTGTVSPTLLQQQLKQVNLERQAMQDLLWGIVQSQGRVRVPKACMHGFNPGDRLDVREVGEDFYLSIDRSNMVVPQGVEGGKVNGEEPEAG